MTTSQLEKLTTVELFSQLLATQSLIDSTADADDRDDHEIRFHLLTALLADRGVSVKLEGFAG
jgi:hypothetical protein